MYDAEKWVKTLENSNYNGYEAVSTMGDRVIK
jgi:hypothetical protein